MKVSIFSLRFSINSEFCFVTSVQSINEIKYNMFVSIKVF